MEKPQSYTNEFKSEAVKLVLDQGFSEREAAKRLSMPKGTLSNWVRDAKGGKACCARRAGSTGGRFPVLCHPRASVGRGGGRRSTARSRN